MYQTKLDTIYEAMSATKPANRTSSTGGKPTSAMDAWARHASSSNGFGDAFTSETGRPGFTDV